jgi:hypothetical protein
VADELLFRCGHPRSKENSRKQGSGYNCRTCHYNRICDVAECDRPHMARGLCQEHYGPAYRRGDFPTARKLTCVEDGCERSVRARKLCIFHYQRLMRSGAVTLQQKNVGKQCYETDCAEPAYTRGFCVNHYANWRSVERHGITREQYLAMLASQGEVCAICERTSPGEFFGRWAIDHDHRCCPGQTSCGRCIRGLLCRACNMGLGQFGDDPNQLMSAAAYLLTRVDVLGGVARDRAVT